MAFSVSTYVPTRAFNALDMPLIVQLAKLAGIHRPRVESSTFKIPSNIPAGSYNGANTPKDAGLYLNSRAEYHWKLRELLENNRVALPCDPSSRKRRSPLSGSWRNMRA